MTLVVNLIAGPGTGKSTCAAATFAELKWAGVNCELVTEYAKDQVWGRTLATLDNQLYIFAKQHHRIFRLLGQVDVIVTDCPLFLSLYYGKDMSDTFQSLVLEEFNALDSFNVFLEREKAFNPAGRTQNEAKAREIDQELRRLADIYAIPHMIVPANRTAPAFIAAHVLDELDRREKLVQ